MSNNIIFKSLQFGNRIYYISNTGIIKNDKEKIIKAHNCKNYERVALYYDGKKKNMYVHRLVMMAFNPKPLNNLNTNKELIIDHIDGNKSNNNLNNLEWVTHSENNKRYYSKNNELSFKRKIIMIDKKNNTKKIFDSVKEAHEYCNINKTLLNDILQGYKPQLNYCELNYFSKSKTNKYKGCNKIIRIDSKGNEIIYNNIREASLKNNINYTSITRSANGTRILGGNYKWRYFTKEEKMKDKLNTIKNLNKKSNEIFKIIENYDKYLITNTGKIYSLISNGFLSLKKNTDGYYKISLRNNNKKSKTIYVHKLVAKIFIPNPDNKKSVTHIDKNKLNNNINNLKWI